MFPHLTTSWGGCIFPGKARNGGPGQPVKLLWACSAWALPGAYSKRHKTPKTWSRQTVLSVHKISLARELLMARLRKRVERLWKWITALLLMLFLWFTAVSQISLNVSLGTFVISFLPAQGGQRSGSAYPRLAGIHSGDIFGLISWRWLGGLSHL